MARTHNKRYWPEELLFEILLRLPVATLLKCKCVCKCWYTLIGSPNFVKSHFSHGGNQEHNIFRSTPLFSNETFSSNKVPDHLKMPDNYYLDIVGPLNGIFCVVGPEFEFDSGQKSALWNPATRLFRPLPLACPVFPPNSLIGNVLTGFGIDLLSGDFKLVLLHHLYNIDTGIIQYPLVSIYHSNTNSWRYLEDLESVYPGHYICESPCNTYLNGVYYWFSHCDEDIGDDVSILALDMSNDTFRVMQVPKSIKKFGTLTLYGDSIALISHEVPTTDNFLNIWVMKNEGIWIKKMTLRPREDIQKPLGLWKKNVLLYVTKPLILTMYNFDTGEVKTVAAGRKNHTYHFSRIYSYKESLVSIEKDGCVCLQGDLRSESVKNFFMWSSLEEEW